MTTQTRWMCSWRRQKGARDGSVGRLEEPDHLSKSSVTSRRRHTATSRASSKSSFWAKPPPRPFVVSYDVSVPADPIDKDQQQTSNPWVNVPLTLVLSIHL